MNREDGLDSQVMDDPLPQTKDIICWTVQPFQKTKIAYLSRMVWLSPSLFYPCLFWTPCPHPLATHLNYLSHSLVPLRAFAGQPTFCPSRHCLSWIQRSPPSSSHPWLHSHSPTATCFIPVFTYTSSHTADHYHLILLACDFHTSSSQVVSLLLLSFMSFCCTLLIYLSHAKAAIHPPPPMSTRWPHIPKRLQMPAIQNSNMITSPNRTWNQAWFWQTSRKNLLRTYSAQLTLLGLSWRWEAALLQKSI
jgi:hypothetical protein